MIINVKHVPNKKFLMIIKNIVFIEIVDIDLSLLVLMANVNSVIHINIHFLRNHKYKEGV